MSVENPDSSDTHKWRNPLRRRVNPTRGDTIPPEFAKRTEQLGREILLTRSLAETLMTQKLASIGNRQKSGPPKPHPAS